MLPVDDTQRWGHTLHCHEERIYYMYVLFIPHMSSGLSRWQPTCTMSSGKQIGKLCFIQYFQAAIWRHRSMGRVTTCPVLAREHYRISPPRFLADCRKRQLNQASFVCCVLCCFAFSGLSLVLVTSFFDLSSVHIFQHIPTWMALYSLFVLKCH